MNAPLLWTTARWYNSGTAKVLAHTGPLTQFRYGTDTMGWHVCQGKPADDGLFQLAIITTKTSGVIGFDVDEPDVFPGSASARLLSKADASTVRGSHFHCYLDCRHVPHGDWPTQGRMGIGEQAWGDVKSNGWMAAPACRHHTGDLYLATGKPVIRATRAIIDALHADLASYAAPSGVTVSTGGRGRKTTYDHDTYRMKVVMNAIVDGLSEAGIRAAWEAAPDHDGSCNSPDGFSDRDYERHRRSASVYAAKIIQRNEMNSHFADIMLRRGVR